MRIGARADYGLRALVELSQAGGGRVTSDELARRQGLPQKFLEVVLGDLRRAGMVTARRGGGGGYRLARGAEEITVADVLLATGCDDDLDGSPVAGVWDDLAASFLDAARCRTVAEVSETARGGAAGTRPRCRSAS